MRILLFNPPPVDGAQIIREGRCMQRADSWATAWPPLSLCLLAAIAARHGAEVSVWDGNVEPGADGPALLRVIDGLQPDVMVFAPAFPTLPSDASLAERVARAHPEVRLIGFGGLFTLLGVEAMELFPSVELGIHGEPELAFDAILESLLRGDPPRDLPGVMTRDDDGEIQPGPEPVLVADLDSLPLPARGLLETKRYRLPHNGRPYALVNTARGCTFPCGFCIATIYHGRSYRRHSVAYILEDLRRCQQEHGLSDFLFWEEAITLDRAFVLELCEGIRSAGLKIGWSATTRADKLDREVLQAMRAAGCELLGLGVESGSQAVLDAAGKGERLEDIRHGIVLCRDAGIRTMGHFVLGVPGETRESLEQTIRYAPTLGLDYLQAYPMVPYPGTPLGDQARERGWVHATRWEQFDLGGPCILDRPGLPATEIDRAVRRVYRGFYLRPTFMARQVPELLHRPRQLFQAGRFLRWMARGGS